MRFVLPGYVEKCINVIESAGHEVFCVGGAVRDLLSGMKEPEDFDLAVSCPPTEIEKLFPHTVPTGIKHGTVTVLADGIPVEVTTYRTDGGYSDARHPDSVRFVGDIKEDLARRDFTVNAIAYNPKTGIFDPFDGCGDLKNHLLRTVGDPDRRFTEDALRIMRLYRFSSQLNFSIDPDTAASAEGKLNTLKNVSAERIFTELKKMLAGSALSNASRFFELGGLSPFGVNKCDISPVCRLPSASKIRLAALCLLSASDPKEVCCALRCDNETKQTVCSLCQAVSEPIPGSRAAIKRFLSRYGDEIFSLYIPLAQVMSGADKTFLTEGYSAAKQNSEPYSIAHLAVGGDELLALGLKGEAVGRTLNRLLDAVIDNPALNERDKLINLITNDTDRS